MLENSEKSNPKYLITLVHGTFATKAKWISENSDFRKFISQKLGNQVEFQVPKWSGKNIQRDRKRAAKELADFLSNSKGEKEGYHHYVIAHSHGGNIALYATEHAHLEDKIKGIMCMNTPFFCVVPRNVQQYMGFPLSILLSLMITICWSYINSLDLLLNLFSDWLKYIALTPLLILAILLFVLLREGLEILLRRIDKLINHVIQTRNRVMRKIQLPKTNIPILSLWTSGDEVSSGFGTLVGIAGLPIILMHKYFLILCYGVIIIGLIFKWIPYESLLIKDNMIYLILNYLLMAGIYLLIIIFGIIILSLITGLIVILPFGLGISAIIYTLLIRVFTTPVPVCADNTEFSIAEPIGKGLSHSEIYSSKEATDILIDWILSKHTLAE
ncbi:MAG: DUF2974 domain-containing protein [candidate division Zixibacteria bacterium]|nr:DUF2974 domain-containing protein [candidate division Zixibacteria bacterium]